jgi:hypothetical protein
MKIAIIILGICFLFTSAVTAQSKINTRNFLEEDERPSITTDKMIEIRSYNLKPGSRGAFHELFINECLPILYKWNIHVAGFGPSINDENSYYLIRAYRDLNDMQQTEDAFYNSDDWKKGPREKVLSYILNYTTIVLQDDELINLSNKIYMKDSLTLESDSAQLSALNAKFIKNFLNQDAAAHDKIIHKDFVCIESNGAIILRDEYLKDWATDYQKSGYTSFAYTDEFIRIFGNMALVRSKTVYTKMVDGKKISGNTIYTDTYIKENGEWKCVQAQLTAVKNN